MKRKSSLYIKDILEAMKKIEEFTQGMSFEDFIRDDKTSSAVVRKLEIIGEAVKQLPEEVRSRFSEIPWGSMAKTRAAKKWILKAETDLKLKSLRKGRFRL